MEQKTSRLDGDKEIKSCSDCGYCTTQSSLKIAAVMHICELSPEKELIENLNQILEGCKLPPYKFSV